MGDMLIGFLIGISGGLIAAFVLMSRYKTTLVLCSKMGTPEKLENEFYYVVPEREYLRIKTEALICELARERRERKQINGRV